MTNPKEVLEWINHKENKCVLCNGVGKIWVKPINGIGLIPKECPCCNNTKSAITNEKENHEHIK